MKLLRLFTLSLMLGLNGLPLTVRAQESAATFALPEGRAGSAYQVSIEDVLQNTYGLKLDTEKRRPVFRWSIADGELPPGLIIRANGIIAGVPRLHRQQPYLFQARVVDASIRGSGSLVVSFSLAVKAPGIKLSKITAPSLVPVGKLASQSSHDSNSLGTQLTKTAPVLFEAEERAGSHAAASAFKEAMFFVKEDSLNEVMKERADPGASAGDVVLSAQAATTCDEARAPAPTATPGPNTIIIDARTGSVTSEKTQFKKGERITVVVDNKNPYLYTYEYSTTLKDFPESAIATFLPLLGGLPGELAAPPAAAAAPKAAPDPDRATGGGSPECPEADKLVGVINTSVAEVVRLAGVISDDLKKLKSEAETLKNKYERGMVELKDVNASRPQLWCASNEFLSSTQGGVSQATLKKVKEETQKLKDTAEFISATVKAISQRFPDCADSAKLLEVSIFADGLTKKAGEYTDSAEKITKVANDVEAGRKKVAAVLKNPNAFFEQHTEGGFSTTKGILITVTPKPIEESTPARKPITAEFKLGDAPFFSLSGGMVFSGLRKVQYERVQGFERDRQGNEVLVDGKPNFTTVVGLQEGSRTRITPMLFLNGRLPGTARGRLDGVHLSLGITAKNDNKGTDVEYLVGPSFSFLEDSLFLTVGGYAGRQQRLEGNLFEGVAVPEGVDELPIRKDYRWNFGFGISYRLPINR